MNVPIGRDGELADALAATVGKDADRRNTGREKIVAAVGLHTINPYSGRDAHDICSSGVIVDRLPVGSDCGVVPAGRLRDELVAFEVLAGDAERLASVAHLVGG